MRYAHAGGMCHTLWVTREGPGSTLLVVKTVETMDNVEIVTGPCIHRPGQQAMPSVPFATCLQPVTLPNIHQSRRLPEWLIIHWGNGGSRLYGHPELPDSLETHY